MRVAVVSGASSGIGAALIGALRERGWHTVGLSRRASAADEHEPCDISDRTSVEETAQRILERHGSIDLLVNNAGAAARSRFLNADVARIEEVMRTNYLGSVWLTLALVDALERGAHVVNVVSVAGLIGDGPYSASKHALLAFSRSLAVELAPRGVSVHTINPGYVETPGFPQRERLGPIFARVAVDPPFVVARILSAIDHDRREIIVPRWYRLPVLLQTAAPATFARLRALARR